MVRFLTLQQIISFPFAVYHSDANYSSLIGQKVSSHGAVRRRVFSVFYTLSLLQSLHFVFTFLKGCRNSAALN